MGAPYPLILIRSLAQGIASQKAFAEVFSGSELITATWPLSCATFLSVEEHPPESWDVTLITSTHALAWLRHHPTWLEKMQHKPVYVIGVAGFAEAQALGCTKIIMAGPTAPDLVSRIHQDRRSGSLDKAAHFVYLRGAVVRHNMPELLREQFLTQYTVYTQTAIFTPPSTQIMTWFAAPHQSVGVTFYALSSVDAWCEALQHLTLPPEAYLEAWCLSATIARAIQQRPHQAGFKVVYHPDTPTPEALMGALRRELSSVEGVIRDSINVHN